MFIEKVELENYRCYKYHIEEFKEGLNIITGSNGTGKTTIVESIAYALFGNKLTRGKANSWVREGSKHGKVKLYIDDFIITRGDNEQHVQNLDGEILAKQHVGVDEWVFSTFNLTPDLFSTANYIAQKDIESFSGLQSAERIKRVEKLLRIDILDTVKDKAKQEAKHIKNDIKHLDTTISSAKAEMGDSDDKLDDLTNELSELQEELKEAESIYEGKLKKYLDYENQLRLWNRKKKLLQKKDKMTYTSFDKKAHEYASIKKDIENNISIQASLDKLKDIEAKDETELVDELRQTYIEANAVYKQLENVTEKCPTCSQTIPDATSLISKRNEAKQRMDDAQVKGIEAKSRLEKFKLQSKIVDHPFTLDEITTILSDCNNSIVLEQLKDYEGVSEPEVVEIYEEKGKVSNIRKRIDSIKTETSSYNKAKTVLDTYEDMYTSSKNRLDNILKFVKFIDKYRKEFSQNVVPLIQKNSSTIFNYLTKDKYGTFDINNDYSIEDYDTFSGSEADSASFAIRMAIANISRIGSFNAIILDEIAASFDEEKENLLLDVLEKTDNQIIYISHGNIV